MLKANCGEKLAGIYCFLRFDEPLTIVRQTLEIIGKTSASFSMVLPWALRR
jgi:hypothetical protein